MVGIFVGDRVGVEVNGAAVGVEVTGATVGVEVTGAAVGVEVTGAAVGVEVTGAAVGVEVAGAAVGVDVTGAAVGVEVTGAAVGDLVGALVGQTVLVGLFAAPNVLTLGPFQLGGLPSWRCNEKQLGSVPLSVTPMFKKVLG